jgi:hypothetical protein
MTTPPHAKRLPVQPTLRQSLSPWALGKLKSVLLQMSAETNNHAASH